MVMWERLTVQINFFRASRKRSEKIEDSFVLNEKDRRVVRVTRTRSRVPVLLCGLHIDDRKFKMRKEEKISMGTVIPSCVVQKRSSLFFKSILRMWKDISCMIK